MKNGINVAYNEYMMFCNELAQNAKQNKCFLDADYDFLTSKGYLYNPNYYNIDHKATIKCKTHFCDRLIPEPFAGDISLPDEGKKKVYIIQLNPGFGGNEYKEQYIDSDHMAFREVLIDTIEQNFKNGSNCVFWPMDRNPYFNGQQNWANKEGSKWWKQKIDQNDQSKSLLNALAENWNVNKTKALKRLSKQLVNIEMIPYHSIKFSQNIAENLTAYKRTKKFIEDCLIPLAKNNKILLIFLRHQSAFDFSGLHFSDIGNGNDKSANIIRHISYGSDTLSIKSPVGKEIFDYLK